MDRSHEESQPLDEARASASSLVALLDLLGKDATAEDIHRAALVPLSDEAAQAAFNVACALLMNLDCLTAILGGACSEERIRFFAALLDAG